MPKPQTQNTNQIPQQTNRLENEIPTDEKPSSSDLEDLLTETIEALLVTKDRLSFNILIESLQEEEPARTIQFLNTFIAQAPEATKQKTLANKKNFHDTIKDIIKHILKRMEEKQGNAHQEYQQLWEGFSSSAKNTLAKIKPLLKELLITNPPTLKERTQKLVSEINLLMDAAGYVFKHPESSVPCKLVANPGPKRSQKAYIYLYQTTKEDKETPRRNLPLTAKDEKGNDLITWQVVPRETFRDTQSKTPIR